MINPIDSYVEAGQGAAIARNHKDEARANHWTQWARKAYWLEKEGEDRKAAQAAFDSAYRATRRI